VIDCVDRVRTRSHFVEDMAFAHDFIGKQVYFCDETRFGWDLKKSFPGLYRRADHHTVDQERLELDSV